MLSSILDRLRDLAQTVPGDQLPLLLDFLPDREIEPVRRQLGLDTIPPR